VAFIKDDRGRYLFGNPAWARQFGRPAGELIGQADVQLWPPATAETFRRSDEAAFASGQPIETVESGQRPDGSPYHALVYKFVFQNAAGQRLLGGLALDITSRKEAEAEISRSREQLRLLAAHLQSIREEERTRIAREIHDELGQMLTGLKMDLAWMERRLAAGSLADSQAVLVDKCRSMADLLDRMVKSVRKIAAELRPGVLDDLGLVPALEWQAREFQTRTGVECHLETRLGVTEIPRDLGTAVFRIFQESLTNVARHAQASRVQASLVADGHALHLVVHDNGRGITDAQQANAKSFGLLGMRERAATLGGECHIAGQPGAGTTITVRIPLPPPAPTS
ncbi:MAG TPA: PAS domain-containing protein, partial [Methylomirabilota bacterium]|nr:PAS domain-containing protein [Methylomirabilota bacterium]